jgi:hypothetical protein
MDLWGVDFWHEGGLVGASGKKIAPRYHDGGLAPGEVPAILKKGELVLSEKQTKKFIELSGGPMLAVNPDLFRGARKYHDGMIPGLEKLLTPMPRTMPAREMTGSGENVKVEFHVHGVTDADSFRRSRPQMMADLSRAVQKARKYT